MWNRTVPLLLMSIAFAGCATAGSSSFAVADMNDDELVSRAEFSDYMDGLNTFGTYDADADAQLTPMEYRSSVNPVIQGDAYFRGFDRDHSGHLTEEEFLNGLFASYDRDGDGWLSRAEFDAAAAGVVVVQ